jgi:hypothetical protein
MEAEYIEAPSSRIVNLRGLFLNMPAGAVFFEQNPAERVTMQRWIDGGNGDL